MFEGSAGGTVRLATEEGKRIRQELSNGYADRCTVCGDVEYDASDAEIEGGAMLHAFDCAQCGSYCHIIESYMSIEDGGRVTVTDTSVTQCSSPTCDWIPLPIDRTRVEATDETTFEVPYETILSVQIEEHHISYEPEITLLVCSPCHGRIHSDDSDLESLQPNMSRQGWER